MKKLLLAATALTLMAAPAHAQTGPYVVELDGTVAAACNLPAITEQFDMTPYLGLGPDGYLAIGNGGGFTTLFDLSTVFAGETIWCNTATQVSVYGNRLVHESLPDNTYSHIITNGFAYTLPVRIANLNVGGAGGVTFGANALNPGSTLDNGGPVSLTSAGPFAGGVSGQVQLWQVPNRPAAGDYDATWQLVFTPS